MKQALILVILSFVLLIVANLLSLVLMPEPTCPATTTTATIIHNQWYCVAPAEKTR